VYLRKYFVDLSVPQRPFEPLDLVAYLLTQLCLALHQTVVFQKWRSIAIDATLGLR
jgi:hypothetical protein